MVTQGHPASRGSRQAFADDPRPPRIDAPSQTSPIGPESRQIQSRYTLASPTFKMLCCISGPLDRRVVLHTACQATELRSFPMKQTDRGFFRAINDHTGIPYPISGVISEPWHKAFLLVQIDLQKDNWPNKISPQARRDLYQESGRIYKLLDGVLRCLVDILGQRRDGRGVSVTLDVLRSIKAGVWEGSDKELRQVEGIGAKSMEKLVQAGIKSIKQLRKLEFYHIERLLSRNPPFGHTILRQLAGFPVLTIQFDIVGQSHKTQEPAAGVTKGPGDPGASLSSNNSPCIARMVLGYENEDLPSWNKKAPWATIVLEGDDGRLIWFWRGSMKRLIYGKELIVGLNVNRGEEVKVIFACEEIVGTTIRNTYRA